MWPLWRLLIVCVAMVSMSMAKHMDWEEYKETYGLSFSHRKDRVRRSIFDENLNTIDKHNKEADLGRHSHWLGVNRFAHMTNKEYVARTMVKSDKSSGSANGTAPVLEFGHTRTRRAADEVDWRTKGCVTPVKDRGQCYSSWAFSATGSLECQWFLNNGILVSLSEQQLLDCSVSYGNYGCQGGMTENAFQYITENGGITTEASYPYGGVDGECRFDEEGSAATITGFVNIMSGETALKDAVTNIGPISVNIDASHPSFQLYHSGVYEEPNCSTTMLDLSALVVGYGFSSGGKPYWLVKNSWGTSWGDNGYIMIARNNNNMCGIATEASYPLV